MSDQLDAVTSVLRNAKDRIKELATTLQDIEIQLTGMELQHDVIHILYELVTNLLTYFTSY